MKTIASFILILFLIWCLSAQVSVNAAYAALSASKWNDLVGDDLFPGSGYKLGIDYWFKLKNKRIEFTPELTYSQFTKSRGNNDVKQTLDARFIGFHFITNIYPMVFGNDCICPTFNYVGSFIVKGFFVQVSPGIDFFRGQYKNKATEQYEENTSSIFNIGIGVGIDIGVLPIVTLTPFASYRYYLETNWEVLADNFSTVDPTPEDAAADNPNQFHIGLKLGFRFDELRNYGWRR